MFFRKTIPYYSASFPAGRSQIKKGKQAMSFSLPPDFSDHMKQLLGEQFPSFVSSLAEPRTYGLRLNTSRMDPGDFERLIPFPVTRIPWIKDGYFYSEKEKPSRHPFYQAGLYYLTDPGAMTVISRLDIRPGHRVLDLCAAPGGKSVAAANALAGQGLLLANDISRSRAKILLRNLEQCGTANMLVTNETADRLAEFFPGYFDRVILDAPCSGEGMFRKEEAMLKDWSAEKSRQLCPVQRSLLESAAALLRPGGLLMYSTCTFEPAENEEAVACLLLGHPEMELLQVDDYSGFEHGIRPENAAGLPDPDVLARCVRIYPHRMRAEGHFFALLKKREDAAPPAGPDPVVPRKKSRRMAEKQPRGSVPSLEPVRDFMTECGLFTIGGIAVDWSRMEIRGEKVYYLPETLIRDGLFEPGRSLRLTGTAGSQKPVKGHKSRGGKESSQAQGLTFLRHGLYVGDVIRGRFEPSHQLALALHKEDVDRCISFSAADPDVAAWLAGESLRGKATITDDPAMKGWQVVCVDGYPLSFGRVSGGILKNRIPAGWRLV